MDEHSVEEEDIDGGGVAMKYGRYIDLDDDVNTDLRGMNLEILLFSSSTKVMFGGTEYGPLVEIHFSPESPAVKSLPTATNSKPV
ncbi:uncharacterized protein DS421_10g302310 [Arachis hypogaea]|nr:uncharacterized protein DS421_10g302310 [Arachis hypogaea]